MGSTSDAHVCSNGSLRVRHQRAFFVCDGSGPLCHARAARSLIAAAAAAAFNVFPSIRRLLKSLTCASVTIGLSTSPGTRPELFAPDDRTRRQDGGGPAKVVVANRQK
jgi:hypothetical protein